MITSKRQHRRDVGQRQRRINVDLRLEQTFEFEFISHGNEVGKGQTVVINLNGPHEMTGGL
jgi:hypothetical protein